MGNIFTPELSEINPKISRLNDITCIINRQKKTYEMNKNRLRVKLRILDRKMRTVVNRAKKSDATYSSHDYEHDIREVNCDFLQNTHYFRVYIS